MLVEILNGYIHSDSYAWTHTKKQKEISFISVGNWPWHFNSSCFVPHISMMYCLKSFPQIQICHPLTSLFVFTPVASRWVLLQLIMTWEYWKTSNPAVLFSLRFINPISTEFCPTCVREAPAEDSATPPNPVLCLVALSLAIKPTDNCRGASSPWEMLVFSPLFRLCRFS